MSTFTTNDNNQMSIKQQIDPFIESDYSAAHCRGLRPETIKQVLVGFELWQSDQPQPTEQKEPSITNEQIHQFATSDYAKDRLQWSQHAIQQSCTTFRDWLRITAAEPANQPPPLGSDQIINFYTACGHCQRSMTISQHRLENVERKRQLVCPNCKTTNNFEIIQPIGHPLERATVIRHQHDLSTTANGSTMEAEKTATIKLSTLERLILAATTSLNDKGEPKIGDIVYWQHDLNKIYKVDSIYVRTGSKIPTVQGQSTDRPWVTMCYPMNEVIIKQKANNQCPT